ncbi:hypothetical protein [Campylobacter sp. MG1]|uniref:hypothetical protein n=1 Tax=Campylobacter sp. MG1 TaxID=2976332 RepID=UPI00226CA4C3|nr:hypothetical protein [Campylobacter sp. MG1]
MRKAFTMIELIFIIVIIGILSAIALPNFFDLNFKSEIAKVKSEVNAINSRAKSEFLNNVISGRDPNSYTTIDNKGGKMFTNIFKEGLRKGTVNKGWFKSSAETSVSNTSTYPILALVDKSYDPMTDYQKYLEQELKRAGLIKDETVIAYKYSISEKIYYSFLFRSKKAEMVCVKAVCNGCNKSRRDTMNNMIRCDTEA